MVILIRFLPLIYLVLINIVAFAMFGIDKHRAFVNEWRISERALFIVALLGGSVGAILGMKTFHHKTLKKSFRWGLPAILILQLLAVAVFIYFDLH